MKGKRPTVAQRKVIEKTCKLNSSDWLIQKDSPALLQIVHHFTGAVRIYSKEGSALHLTGIKGA